MTWGQPAPPTPPGLPAHLASCSTPPRPLCSPAAGAHRAAGAAGLWGQRAQRLPAFPPGRPHTFPTTSCRKTHLSSCSTLPRPWCSPTGRWVGAAAAPPGWVGLRGPGQGLALGLGAAGSSGSSRRPRQHWGLQLQQRLYLQARGASGRREGSQEGSQPTASKLRVTYLGHEEQVVATGGRYCPSPGVGTGEEGGRQHWRTEEGTHE